MVTASADRLALGPQLSPVTTVQLEAALVEDIGSLPQPEASVALRGLCSHLVTHFDPPLPFCSQCRSSPSPICAMSCLIVPTNPATWWMGSRYSAIRASAL